MEIRKLKPNDPTFPAVLREIPAPPQQLYVLGDLEPLLARPRLAVVGTRKITNYGRQVTNQFVSEITRRGVVTVSGLAFGVDSLAHEATLRSGGQTIAVLASGLNKITPVSNTNLAKQILENGGTLVSEYPPDRQPQRFAYIARNRIIAGLSKALLITEAGKKSGSLHTAQFALDQAKRVLVVPGSIYDESSSGANQLIKDYAIPVTESNDVFVALGMPLQNPEQLLLFGNTDDETVLLQLIQKGISTNSRLLEESGMSVPVFNQTLSSLEIDGRIQFLAGFQWVIRN